MRTARRVIMVVLSAVAMLALLLGLAALSFGKYDGVAFYLALMLVSVVVVARLWRTERRLRRAEEALLPPELRPRRRTPRRPITFPIAESLAVFAVWYAIAVVVDRVITGDTNTFELAAVAPFAAFMLTTITIAGRHMAFRLTAEDEEEARP
ncbi:MAG TPA: hypothetical protein VFM93_08805 [Candidatus Limnocylindria bacterium]|nr:hypothetical protein [Candidatus Limnocylindria bacterium]